MIVYIDEEYVRGIGGAKSAHLYGEILAKGHYLDGTGACIDLIIENVEKHASTYQKEQMKTGKSINLTKSYVTTLQD